jgi:PAS domain-containing protein
VQGRAGAWVAVAAGLSSFWLGVLVYRRQRSRFIEPVLDLDAALVQVRAGDRLRRCHTGPAPVELLRVRQNLDWMLDQAQEQTGVSTPAPSAHEALLALLDALPGPAAWVDRDGTLRAVNQSLLDQPGAPGMEGALAAARGAGAAPAGWSLRALPGGGALVWVEAGDQPRSSTQV